MAVFIPKTPDLRRVLVRSIVVASLAAAGSFAFAAQPPENNPSGTNTATNLPWSPAADGLRNLTGKVNPDGTVTIRAITSTISGNGDTGADPNKFVAITDSLSNTDASVAATEKFATLRSAGFAEVLRGVSFTPGTDAENHGGK